jgi:cellobiose phosphorylase
MTGCASLQECEKSYAAALSLLKDPEHGGFRLNTNFGEEMLDLGRAFSFSYGDKENGAFFSHMAVMFANALYKRNLVSQGFSVLDSVYKMSSNTEKSLIFPCIPEYFNKQGRGLYCYITGSASWMVLTLVTEVFGIKGFLGRLVFSPKLVASQFNGKQQVNIQTVFQGKQLDVTYHNPQGLPFEEYKVTSMTCQGHLMEFEWREKVAYPAKDLIKESASELKILIELGAEKKRS